MKKLIAILFLVATTAAQATQPIPDGKGEVKVTVKWSFENVVEGYDHDTKTELYVDGNLVAVSSVTKETKSNSVTAKVSKGIHTIKVINYAYYEGKWEAHTIENTYSIDCVYETRINCDKKKNVITLVFDINSGTKQI